MRTSAEPLAVALISLALAACSGASGDNPPCVDGERTPCACDDGGDGTQLCVAGSLSSCVCEDDPDADDAALDAVAPDAGDSGDDTGEADGGDDTTGGDDTGGTPDADCPEPLFLYPDADGDGHGDIDAEPVVSCLYLAGYVIGAADCDDDNRDVFPTAPELCDTIDNDCDTLVDERVVAVEQWPDADDDGYGDAEGESLFECALVDGYATNADDCDDTQGDVHPGLGDLCDGRDEDCDDEVDEDASFTVVFVDDDNDGYGASDALPLSFCDVPEGFADNRLDCDDSSELVNPDAVEICNLQDDDCDRLFDEGTPLLVLWPDDDEDTYGDAFAAPEYACEPIAGWVGNDTDCDDSDGDVSPLGAEVCNGVDDDCDGAVDNGAAETRSFYADADDDGYGDGTARVEACTAPPAFVDTAGDCDDRFDTVNPGATETCNGVDDDCNGAVDDGVVNRCGGCGPEPAEVCGNFVDDDCDGAIDETDEGCFCDGRTAQPCYTGAPDTLGIGACRGGTISCACPGGARFCEDGTWGACAGEVLPAVELCDNVDNDCDGRVDEGLRNRCGVCGPDLAETCNGVDDDCDGAVDEFVTQACGVCAGDESEEACGNGLDDDCDGSVDEGCDCGGPEDAACYPGPPATRGVGVCSDGVRDCYEPTLSGACTGAVLPSLEICNGEDDDCDGVTDESSTGCSVCGAADEICNDVDDDCDGFVDEGLRNACGDCLAAVVPEESRPLSFCNDVDDDCDGFVDEGLINACGNCDESCYTDGWDSDDEFEDGGEGDGVSPDDGLRLDTSTFQFADLWVANSADDTVTRINTNTGAVVGTYEVGVHAGAGNDSPSRTAVDLDGNAWVANRAPGIQGSVTKIRGGDCVTDCVMFHVELGSNNGRPRGLAVAADNNVWVGVDYDADLYEIDNETGDILNTYDTGIGRVYGLVMDGEGILWIATIDKSNGIAAFDTNTRTMLGNWTTDPAMPYGIAVDGEGNVWFGTWTHGRLGRLDRSDFDAGTITFDYYGTGLSNTRGVAVDAIGQVWVASSGNDKVARFTLDGTMRGSEAACDEPVGVGVASDGNVWSMCLQSDQAQRWAPDGSFIEDVAVGEEPYSYSDMTGFALRAFTAPSGRWTQEFDCGFEGCGFEAIRWTAVTPAGTSVSVRARTRTSGGAWSAWSPSYTSSPADTSDDLGEGRYVQVELNLATSENEITPVVTALDVEWQRP